MTISEMSAAVELYASMGRTHVPISITLWRECMATKAVKGKSVTKDGRTKFVPATSRVPPELAAGKRHKADCVEKGLKANREKRR